MTTTTLYKVLCLKCGDNYTDTWFGVDVREFYHDLEVCRMCNQGSCEITLINQITSK